ncbi:MAG: DEAD/DEAH box helicase, partial [Pyrinomonadaceae bacterium]
MEATDRISIQTKLVDVPSRLLTLSAALRGKLAVALTGLANKTNPEQVTVEDLLNYFPARYEDRSNLLSIDMIEDGMEAAVEIVVKVSGGFRVGKNRGPKQPPLFLFEISGADVARKHRPIVVKWFVSGKSAEHVVDYYQDRFSQNTRFVAYGKWEFDDRRNTFALMVNKPEELEILPQDSLGFEKSGSEPQIKFQSPDSEITSDTDLLEDNSRPEFVMIHTARRVPVYRKLGPFQTKRLREIIHSVLQYLDPNSVEDHLPADLLGRQNLVKRSRALTEIHFPPDESTISDYERFRSAAQKRLIFDEFFWLSFSMQLLRGERQKEPKGTVIEISETTKQRLREILPFELTTAQKKVIGEIFGDLKSDAPMNRLIQGDVGSGKTIVAFLAIFAAMENGYQAALMAPTEILAEQHFRNASKIFADSGYRVELLVGSTRAAAKRKTYNALESGEIDLIIGTHAIIQDAVSFS